MGRRNLTKQILDNAIELVDGDIIGRVLEPRGKNIHAVEYPDPCSKHLEGEKLEDGEKDSDSNCCMQSTLCLLPPKFRSLVWVKRGGFVVFRPYTEKDGKKATDNKVGGTIEHVLFPYHIKRIKQEGKWPSLLSAAENLSDSENSESDSEFVNPNHRHAVTSDSSSDEES